MNFQEEYFKRHLIKSPVIKYVKEGYLILRNSARVPKHKWVVLSITESPQTNHPHDSVLTDMTPLYNSYSGYKNQFQSHQTIMNFDSYQTNIMLKLKSYRDGGFVPVFGVAESRIALLEMFVYIWCNYLLDLYHDQIIKDYYAVIDKNNSIDEKLKFVDKIDGMLLDSSSATRESWKIFRKYSNPDLYCDWVRSWF